jgi:hypothetical protein
MEDKKANSIGCQLQILFEGASELNRFDNLWLAALRLYSALLRRLRKFNKVIKNKGSEGTNASPPRGKKPNGKGKPIPLKSGDTVSIASMDEIKQVLDKDGRTEGVWFMPAMKRYCGFEAKVLKRVNYIFDERAWKMLKCKNMVILEGVICDGEGMFSKEGCDRSCYFFWKESWLNRR